MKGTCTLVDSLLFECFLSEPLEEEFILDTALFGPFFLTEFLCLGVTIFCMGLVTAAAMALSLGLGLLCAT